MPNTPKQVKPTSIVRRVKRKRIRNGELEQQVEAVHQQIWSRQQELNFLQTSQQQQLFHAQQILRTTLDSRVRPIQVLLNAAVSEPLYMTPVRDTAISADGADGSRAPPNKKTRTMAYAPDTTIGTGAQNLLPRLAPTSNDMDGKTGADDNGDENAANQGGAPVPPEEEAGVPVTPLPLWGFVNTVTGMALRQLRVCATDTNGTSVETTTHNDGSFHFDALRGWYKLTAGPPNGIMVFEIISQDTFVAGDQANLVVQVHQKTMPSNQGVIIPQTPVASANMGASPTLARAVPPTPLARPPAPAGLDLDSNLDNIGPSDIVEQYAQRRNITHAEARERVKFNMSVRKEEVQAALEVANFHLQADVVQQQRQEHRDLVHHRAEEAWMRDQHHQEDWEQKDKHHIDINLEEQRLATERQETETVVKKMWDRSNLVNLIASIAAFSVLFHHHVSSFWSDHCSYFGYWSISLQIWGSWSNGFHCVVGVLQSLLFLMGVGCVLYHCPKEVFSVALAVIACVPVAIVISSRINQLVACFVFLYVCSSLFWVWWITGSLDEKVQNSDTAAELKKHRRGFVATMSKTIKLQVGVLGLAFFLFGILKKEL